MVSPSGIVACSGPFTTISGQRNEFHWPVKVNSASSPSAGSDSGRKIVSRMRRCEAPSMQRRFLQLLWDGQEELPQQERAERAERHRQDQRPGRY